jgi:hypothetical protein
MNRSLRSRDWPECRQQRKDDGACDNRDGCDGNERSRAANRVNQRPTWRLCEDARDPCNRHDDANLGLIPVPHGQEIDGKVRP